LLRSYRDSGVIVTFEVQPNMEETVERIGEYSGYSGRFFILTEGTKIFAQPDPLRSDWDFVARFIRGFGDDFYFTGGQIGKRGDGLGGVWARLMKSFQEEISLVGLLRLVVFSQARFKTPFMFLKS